MSLNIRAIDDLIGYNSTAPESRLSDKVLSSSEYGYEGLCKQIAHDLLIMIENEMIRQGFNISLMDHTTITKDLSDLIEKESLKIKIAIRRCFQHSAFSGRSNLKKFLSSEAAVNTPEFEKAVASSKELVECSVRAVGHLLFIYPTVQEQIKKIKDSLSTTQKELEGQTKQEISAEKSVPNPAGDQPKVKKVPPPVPPRPSQQTIAEAARVLQVVEARESTITQQIAAAATTPLLSASVLPSAVQEPPSQEELPSVQESETEVINEELIDELASEFIKKTLNGIYLQVISNLMFTNDKDIIDGYRALIGDVNIETSERQFSAVKLAFREIFTNNPTKITKGQPIDLEKIKNGAVSTIFTFLISGFMDSARRNIGSVLVTKFDSLEVPVLNIDLAKEFRRYQPEEEGIESEDDIKSGDEGSDFFQRMESRLAQEILDREDSPNLAGDQVEVKKVLPSAIQPSAVQESFSVEEPSAETISK